MRRPELDLRHYGAYPRSRVVREGDLVRITVVNRSFESHPWLHLESDGVAHHAHQR